MSSHIHAALPERAADAAGQAVARGRHQRHIARGAGAMPANSCSARPLRRPARALQVNTCMSVPPEQRPRRRRTTLTAQFLRWFLRLRGRCMTCGMDTRYPEGIYGTDPPARRAGPGDWVNPVDVLWEGRLHAACLAPQVLVYAARAAPLPPVLCRPAPEHGNAHGAGGLAVARRCCSDQP